MIDIHSHIVFDVDDGPKSIEESKSFLERPTVKEYEQLFPLRIDEKGCLKLLKKKSQPIF